MGRPPQIPVEKKTRIVLSVLAGEVSIAEAARREQVSEQAIGRWKANFLEAAGQRWRRVSPVRRLGSNNSRLKLRS
jgi:transposase-like protein